MNTNFKSQSAARVSVHSPDSEIPVVKGAERRAVLVQIVEGRIKSHDCRRRVIADQLRHGREAERVHDEHEKRYPYPHPPAPTARGRGFGGSIGIHGRSMTLGLRICK